MSIINICSKSLQGKDIILFEQKDRLSMCAQDLRALISACYDGENGIDALLHASTLQNHLTTLENQVLTQGGVHGSLKSLSSVMHQNFDPFSEGEQDFSLSLLQTFFQICVQKSKAMLPFRACKMLQNRQATTCSSLQID